MEMAKKWKNGFLLGKFLPPHLGHMYLIDEALKQPEKLTVLVCALPDNIETFMTGRKRFEAVREHYLGFKNVNVVFHQGLDPQYPHEHTNFWNIWMKIILSNIDPETTDVVFSSEEYGEEIAKRLQIDHCLIDIDRVVVPISGTKVRENIFENWHFLPKETQKRLVKKIAILGPESTGKSTLVKRLARYFGVPYIKEYGREFGELGKEYDDRGFREIAIVQNELVKEAVEAATSPIILCDTDNITTEVFYKLYTELGKTASELDFTCFEFVDYDLRILLHPKGLPFVQDGTRTTIKESERERHYNLLLAEIVVQNLNFELTVAGDKAFYDSIEFINQFLKNG